MGYSGILPVHRICDVSCDEVFPWCLLRCTFFSSMQNFRVSHSADVIKLAIFKALTLPSFLSLLRYNRITFDNTMFAMDGRGNSRSF